MEGPRSLLLLAAAFAIMVVACGSEVADDATSTKGASSSSAGSTSSTGGGGSTSTSTSSANGTGGGGVTCEDHLIAAPGSEFCESVAPPIDCAGVDDFESIEACGVAFPDPAATLVLGSGTGAPDLACFTPAGYPAKADGVSLAVTMTGVVRIFSHGCQSNDVTIEVRRVTRSGPTADPTLGEVVAQGATASDCSQTGGVPATDPDCGTRYECPFTLSDVPAGLELAITTSGAEWATVSELGVFASLKELNGAPWKHDLVALSTDDYEVIAQAKLGESNEEGLGMVLGQIHDCDDAPLEHAIVSTNLAVQTMSYFTGDAQHPLPDLSTGETGPLAIFGLFNVVPGPFSVGAIGQVDGKTATAGWFRALAFAGAVTYVDLHGVRPFQVP